MPDRRSASPASVRKSPRKSTGAPARLGFDDAWGSGPAGSWKSDASTPAKTSAPKSAEVEAGGAPIVGMADVLFTVFGAVLYGYAINLKKLEAKSFVPSSMPPAMTLYQLLATAVMVAGSHLIYASIWYYPKKFMKLCKTAPLNFFGKHAVAVFGKTVLAWKFMQQLAVMAFVSGGSKATLMKIMEPMTTELWIIAVIMFVSGQILNVAIYEAIGEDGVYYGFKLGRPVPWSSAFPFNVGFRHPQYVGAYVCQLGILLPVTTPETLEMGLGLLTGYWAILYVITSIIEASGDNDK